MNILLVTQYFWLEHFRINDIVLGLVERGHNVTVITGLPNYPEGRIGAGYGWRGPWSEQFGGARVVRVPLFPRGSGAAWRLGLNYLSMAVSASIIGAWRLRRLPFDVIFVFEPSPMTIGLPSSILKHIKQCKQVFWVQDLWPESLVATGAVRARWILRAVGAVTRWIYERCDEILVQSRGFKPHILNLGVDEHKITYVPNPAEAFYRPIPRGACRALDDELPRGFRILYTGNIGAAQDFPTILAAAEATRSDPDIKWLLLGDGRLRSWVAEEITRRRLQATVILLGSCEPEKVPEFCAVADTLLVSLRAEEIFALTIPSKIQSYLACGKPIIASLEGEGAKVITEAAAGLVVPPEKASRLADAARHMQAMKEDDRMEMGQRARRYFEENFEREMVIDRIESILKRNSIGLQ